MMQSRPPDSLQGDDPFDARPSSLILYKLSIKLHTELEILACVTVNGAK